MSSLCCHAATTEWHKDFLGICNYFDSLELSDITIGVAGYDAVFHAHKFILAHGSPWFKAALQGGFQEAHVSHIELVDEGPEAVKGILAHLYGLCYDGSELFFPSEDCEYHHSGKCEGKALAYQIKLLIAADKYGLPPLVKRITEEFPQNFYDMWSEADSQDKEEDFGEVVHMVYEQVPHGCGDKLRAEVADVVAEQMHGASIVLQDLVRTIPELAVDVMNVLTRGRSSDKHELWRAWLHQAQ